LDSWLSVLLKPHHYQSSIPTNAEFDFQACKNKNMQKHARTTYI
jgi:hypothetical protein